VNIEARAADRRVINLKIAGVNDDAHGSADRERDAVDGAMRHRDHLNFERADFDTPAGNYFSKRRRFEKTASVICVS